MDYKYMVFSSVTYSLRGMSLLSRAGIGSRLEKIKSIPSLGGCGYALAVKKELFDNAVKIIEGEGLRIIEVLERREFTS